MQKLLIRATGLWLETLSRIAPQTASRKGFALFCRPWRIPLSDKQRNFLLSAEPVILEHEDLRIRGYRWGHGPKRVLFLHGWQSHSYRWKPYIHALPDDEYTVYSLDAPGHGLSSGNFLSVPLYAEVIENFVRQQGEFHAMVAHSLGGFALLYALYTRPAIAPERVILMATPGEASEFVTVFQQTLRLSERTVNGIIRHFARTYDVTPDYFSLKRFIEEITVPGLIIHDTDDTDAPYDHAVSLHRAWQGSQLITTSGIGHNLKSKEVIEYVRSYLQAAVPQPAA